MRLRTHVVLAFIICVFCTSSSVLSSEDMGGTRERMTLNGGWEIIFDKENAGVEKGWQKSAPWDEEGKPINVPSCFETIAEGAEYDGVVWYRKQFVLEKAFTKPRVFLEFGAVNYAARVWLNGELLGEHVGGYGSFEFDVSGKLKGENTLVVRVVDPGDLAVDGMTLESVIHSDDEEFVNFGGIYRPVELVATDDISIEDCSITPGAMGNSARVKVKVRNHTGAKKQLKLEWKSTISPDKDAVSGSIEAAAKPGLSVHQFEIKLDSAARWSPEDPAIHDLNVSIKASDSGKVLDSQTYRYGNRAFTVANGDFHLNGKPTVLKGLLYRPSYPKTFANPPDESFLIKELRYARDANVNFLHVAGIPPRELVELADEIGILLMIDLPTAEIRGDAPAIDETVKTEIEDIISRFRNNPSVVIWGIRDPAGITGDEEGNALVRYVRSLDPDRVAMTYGGEKGSVTYSALPGNAGSTATTGEQRSAYNSYRWRPQYPFDRGEYNKISSMWAKGEENSELCFVSEFGFGGLADLKQVIEKYGDETGLEDAALYRRYHEGGVKSFAENDLRPVFGTFDLMCRYSQAVQASALREMVWAIRSNARVDGFVYAQLRDTGRDISSGILDVWGVPKKAYTELKRSYRKHLLVPKVFPRNISRDEKATLKVILVTDDPEELRSPVEGAGGKLTLRVGGKGTSGRGGFSRTRVVDIEKKRVQLLRSQKVEVPGGDELIVRVALLKDEQVITASRTVLTKVEERGSVRLRRTVYAYGSVYGMDKFLDPKEHRMEILIDRVAQLQGGSERPIMVVGSNYFSPKIRSSIDLMADALLLVKRGGVLVFLEPVEEESVFTRVGVVDYSLIETVGGYPVFHYSTIHRVFKGLVQGEFLPANMGNIAPDVSYLHTDGRALAGSVDMRGKWAGGDIVVKDYGEGKIILCTYRLLSNLEKNPLASKLVGNIFGYADEVTKKALEPMGRDEVDKEKAELADMILKAVGKKSD